jgi:hypothetical protein
MERAMPSRHTQLPNYPAVEMVLGAIADWVNKFRSGIGRPSEFRQCEPADVMWAANDLGVPPGELREIASKGPGSADLLQKLLAALHVDPKEIAKANPGVLRDLQRLCVSCSDKTRCAHELDVGTAADHFHDYCPNAFTLDALFKGKAETARH